MTCVRAANAAGRTANLAACWPSPTLLERP